MEVRALIFFSLIAEMIALILVNRSFSAWLGDALIRHNAALRYVVTAIMAVAALILLLPSAQTLLKFGSIAWRDMALAVALGICLLLLLEACKTLVHRLSIWESPTGPTMVKARPRPRLSRIAKCGSVASGPTVPGKEPQHDQEPLHGRGQS